ncbi:sugar phosphate isomerase/epimerase family protein [Oscillibacter sp.]|uniref:sugar phosphate isomerase/epimerase family protein n=1 Tax=Oscillibacter sp. TaxID=1945593 RepID=UPI002D7F524F|nr:sugar phosphate isomerase/epimerase [Oscillibacter sp.]
MEQWKFGMELPEGRHPWQVAQSLEWIRSCGYDFFEMSLTGFPLIVHGEVNQAYVKYLKPIFAQSGLSATLHIGTGLDLRSASEYALHQKVLHSSITITAALGARVLTVHFEQASPRQNLEAQFERAYREAAAFAQEKGILLCIENIEVEDYRLVPELIDRVNNPHFRMTLDLGHLYLSTRYFGGDYWEAIDQVVPYAAHVHLHGNTGKFEPMRLQDFDRYRQMGLNERIAFGQGDIHLPPSWGTLPVKESLERLRAGQFQGTILLECGADAYEPFYKEILADVKGYEIIRKSQGESNHG